jgi:hypothetical protein
MKRRVQPIDAAKAGRWARRLSMRVKKIVAANPGADPDNIRHTLILLELPPLERLRQSLIRGRRRKNYPAKVSNAPGRRSSRWMKWLRQRLIRCSEKPFDMGGQPCEYGSPYYEDNH